MGIEGKQDLIEMVVRIDVGIGHLKGEIKKLATKEEVRTMGANIQHIVDDMKKLATKEEVETTNVRVGSLERFRGAINGVVVVVLTMVIGALMGSVFVG